MNVRALCKNVFRHDFRKRATHGFVIVILGICLGLSACGRKAPPSYPEGSTYPEEYPTE